jgi:hypothetical protein
MIPLLQRLWQLIKRLMQRSARSSTGSSEKARNHSRGAQASRSIPNEREVRATPASDVQVQMWEDEIGLDLGPRYSHLFAQLKRESDEIVRRAIRESAR